MQLRFINWLARSPLLGLRASVVDLVDVLIPKPLLRLVLRPALNQWIGLDRIEAINYWIDNNFMLKRRQKRCRLQQVETDTAAYLKTHFCSNPFRQVETAPTGLAYVCCPVWLPTPIGRLDDDPVKLWTGSTANDIRESIIDGSFKYCNHLHCPAISGRTLMHRESPQAQAIIARHKSSPSELPEHVILSHDKSCNLSCPSCRTSTYVANSAKQKHLDDFTETTLLPLMRDAKSAMVTGSGDPFGSKHFRNLILRLNSGAFPALTLDMITNGQLLDQRAWSDLKLDDRVRDLQISIDAATTVTYEIVRRGGSFDRLLKNLAFVRDLRTAGKITSLNFSMVVQTLNFREMPAFVELGERFAADGVIFNMIRQRDIFSRDEYLEAFIGNPDHRDYPEFCRTLTAPQLSKRNVQLGNVLEYVRRAELKINAGETSAAFN